MHIEKVDFGALVKQCRNNKGYTQEKLGELIGIGPRQIATIENQGGKTKFDNLEKLIRLLDIPPEAIFRTEAMMRTLEH
jgi:transcriptional regulator with XRE-family HTH domain